MKRFIASLILVFITITPIIAGWNEAQKIVAGDRKSSDYFGFAVAVDGNIAVVGAYGEDHNVSGGDSLHSAGSAYIFKTMDGGLSWTQVQKIVASDRGERDNFGQSVSVSGDIIVIGAQYDAHDASGGSTLSSAGSAYVFRTMDSGASWTQVQKIVASDRAANDYFGESVSVSNDIIAVGAWGEDEDASGGSTLSSAGSVYVFRTMDSGASWTQVQKIVASDRAANDLFGNSVSVSGDVIVSGACYDDEDASGANTLANAGSAYVFRTTDSGASWTQVQKIVASDRDTDDYFAQSVSVSGDIIVVGARFEDEDASSGNTVLKAGSAYVFRTTDSGASWTQVQKIVAGDRAADDDFGWCVSVSGDIIIVGSNHEDEDTSGVNTMTWAGSAYVFKTTDSGASWTQVQKIVASDRSIDDQFGISVSVSSDISIVGAYADTEDASGSNTLSMAGSAYIFWNGTPPHIPITINVPEDYTTIQAGLNAAVSTDTVLVQPGTYHENIFWPETNGIKLMSAGDSSNTIIDGRGLNSVIYMNPQETIIDTSTLIQGFKIMNGGNVNNGGGIFMANSSPTIRSLAIVGNEAINEGWAYGGGLYLTHSAPRVTGVTISNNLCGSNGGGMYLDASSPSMSEVHISGNSALSGGGIYVNSQSYLTIDSSTICDNSAIYGSGLYAYHASMWLSKVNIANNSCSNSSSGSLHSIGSSPILSDVVISGNSRWGMCARNNSHPTLTNVRLTENTAGINLSSSYSTIDNMVVKNNAGRGIEIDGGHATMNNIFISRNTGGGMYIGYSSPIISNLSISHNTTTYDGGGMFITNESNPTISEAVIFSNSAGRDGGGVFIGNSNPTFSDVSIANNISNQSGGGIYLNTSNPTMTRVSIVGNYASEMGGGLYFYTASNPDVSELTISNNSAQNGGGIYVNSGLPAISGCNIVNNEVGVFSVNNANIISAVNNYWGHSSGPMHPNQNHLGLGDSTNLFVNVNPWLTSPNLIAPPIPAQNVVLTGTGNDSLQVCWDSSELADFGGFRLYYDDDSSGHPYANSIDLGLETTYTLMGLDFGTAYFIAVTVYDTDGNESWYSQEVTGTTRVLEIQNLDIAGDEDLFHLVTHDPSITFDYFDSMDETQTDYQIQISTDSTFQSGIIWDSGDVTSDATSVQYTEGLLENGWTYYLQTKVASGAFWSAWSNISFRMNSVPSSPELVSPENGGIVVTQPTLKFLKSNDAEEDAIAYSVYLYNTETMTMPLDSLIGYTGMTDTISWTVSAALDDNAQHWWKVKSFDGYEYNTLTEVRTFLFNISNDEPDPFALISPINESEVASLHPLFSWHPATDVDPVDTVNYVLYLDTPAPGVETFDIGTDTSYQVVIDLLDNTNYSWKVIASDLNGGSTENTGGYQSFRVNTENDLPTAFNLLAPEDESMVVDLTPTLLWEPSSDPDDGVLANREVRPINIRSIQSTNSIREIAAYQVYLDTDSLFAETVPIEVINPTYTPASNLSENMVYYWKVEAVDDVGGILSSERLSFWTNSINTAPSAFELLTPLDGAETTEYPSFSWTASSDIDLQDELSYSLYYGSDITALIEVSLGSGTSYIPETTLYENTEFSWQVIATDLSGATFSTPFRTFMVNTSNDPPLAFNLVYPEHESVISDTSSLLFWDVAHDLDGSEVQYAVLQGESTESLGILDPVSTNYYQLVNPVDGAYYWQVIAFDEFGEETASEVWMYLVNAENLPPDSFTLMSPLGETLNTLLPEFIWTTTQDPDIGDQVSFTLLLGTTPGNLQEIYEGSDVSFESTTELMDNTTYYWQAVATDLSGATTPNEGGYQNFTINTSNDLPVAFELLSPVGEMMVTTLTPEFLWESSSDPDDETIALRQTGKGKFSEDRSADGNSVTVITGYDFYLGTDAELSDAVLVEVIGTSYIPAEDLIENMVYYWAVSALDDSGGVTFSDTASFWTNSYNDHPSAFTMLEPMGDFLFELDILTPTYRWSQSLDSDLYDEVVYHLNLWHSPWHSEEIYVGSDTSYTHFEPLLDNYVYSWEVIAEDRSGAMTAAGIGDSVAQVHFYTNTENDMPEPAVLLSPDSVVVLTSTPTFIWEASFDRDPFEDIEYEVHWWYEGSEWDSIITEETSITISNPLTADNQQYFWQVISMDDEGGIAQSQDYMFWVDFLPEPPGLFSLAGPEDESAGNSTRPELTWQEAIDPDPFDNVHYRVNIATDSSMVNIVYEGISIPEIHVPEIDLQNDTRYYWQVSAHDEDSLQTMSEVWTFDVGYLAVDDGLALPTEYVLDQNYPNPFNPSTTIRYGLPEASNVSLVIYDVRGQVVQTLESGPQSAGWYDVIWNGQTSDGRTISTGIYFARLVAGDYSQVIKMLYLK